MDHTQFKAKQTAAVYVADGLDENTLEAFEMHMMGCTECLEDVETWRSIKHNMPPRARPALAPAAMGRHVHAAMGWRMAASLVVGVTLGHGGRLVRASGPGAEPRLDADCFLQCPRGNSQRR